MVPLIATAQLPVPLGTASNFAVLAGAGITVAGAVETTTITGDIGSHPTLSISGMENVVLIGVNQGGNAVTQTAKDDLVTAYNNAALRPVDFTIGTELGGATLVPAVYDSADGTFELTGILILDGQNDPDAVFIFQMETTLITAANSAIVLTNGAQACNVFWQVGSSATLGSGTDFAGVIMAMSSITLVTGSTVDGNLLARNGAVTIDQGTITLPCRDIQGIPGYTLEKTRTSPLGRPADIGEAIVFTITVVNTGNVPLVTVPLEDTYETAYLTYISSLPASDDQLNGGVINWLDIGPLPAGASASVVVSFIALNSTEGELKTNTVVASPTTRSIDLPVPPLTSDAPYEIDIEIEIIRQLEVDKTFDSATVPDANGNFFVTYTLVVTNAGEASELYTLIDTPLFDPNIIVLSNNVTGHITATFAGGGPYLIVTNQIIAIGATHHYEVQIYARVNDAVQRGLADITPCGEPGQGLFNRASLSAFGDQTLIDDDCGPLILSRRLIIGDTVWVDGDSNGQPDEDLAIFGINNVRVDLFQVIGGVTNFVGFQMTGSEVGQLGYYLFNNLPPHGIYIAQVVLSTVPPAFPVLTTPQRYTMNTATDFPDGAFLRADFGFNNEYGTPIELTSFTAHPSDGVVRLAWETAWEVDTRGYYLYRASAQNPDQRLRINEKLIDGLGSDGGSSYERIDSSVTPGSDYLYWLVEVAIDGAHEWYGPLAVHLGEIQRNTDLARATLVAGDGALVRIRYESLVAAGIPLSQMETAKLQLFIGDHEVARMVSADRSSLQTGDYLLFYVPASNRDQPVTVRQAETGDALTMNWVYVRPRAGAGDIGIAEADETGQAEFTYAPDMVRMLIAGFTSPAVWVLDVTDPIIPSILYGHATVASETPGEFAVYLSIPAEHAVSGIAVQEESVVDLQSFSRE